MRKRSYSPRFARFRRWRWRLRYRQWPLLECVEFQRGGYCRGQDERHGHCTNCGEATCVVSMKINDHSLRRQRVYECWPCKRASISDRHQATLRGMRTHRDWEEITAPVNHDRIIAGQMGEQYPGACRDTIRAFRESGAATAIALDVDAAALQQTISVLGLGDEMYAETRGEQTVLRRIRK